MSKNSCIFRRMGYSLMGLKTAWLRERSFRAHAMAACAVLAGMAFVQPGAAWWAIVLLALAAGSAMEAMNAALEAMCDHFHAERHPAIGAVKDMASGGAFAVNVVTVAIIGVMLADTF